MWSPSLWRVDETYDKLGLAFASPKKYIHGNELKSIYKRSETDMAMYWWQEEDFYRGRQQNKVHPCSLESKIDEIFSSAMVKVDGLRLQNGDIQLE
jgi:hypothetical protein